MDTLSNNWCIKLDAENRDVVIQYFKKEYVANYKGVIGDYYGHYNNDCFMNSEPFGTELTFEEFKTQILGESKFLSDLDNDTQNVFDKTLSNLADLLKYKNAKYGNSVLDPLEIFKGKCKAGDRIDDKLSRIKISKGLRKNDVSDLIGYLVLTCVENNWENFDEFKD